MLILGCVKTCFIGFFWWLLAGCFLLLWGVFGQGFMDQNHLLKKTEQWLQQEKQVWSELTRNSLAVPSVPTLCDANVLSEWQRVSYFPSLSRLTMNQGDKKTQPLTRWLANYRQHFHVGEQIFCNSLNVVGLRYTVALLFLPLFGLAGFIGLVDGLVQRQLRKQQGARESSVLYQRAKEGLNPSLFGAGVLYVGLPTCFNPTPLFLMFALCFGVVFAMAARTYKKYL